MHKPVQLNMLCCCQHHAAHEHQVPTRPVPVPDNITTACNIKEQHQLPSSPLTARPAAVSAGGSGTLNHCTRYSGKLSSSTPPKVASRPSSAPRRKLRPAAKQAEANVLVL